MKTNVAQNKLTQALRITRQIAMLSVSFNQQA